MFVSKKNVYMSFVRKVRLDLVLIGRTKKSIHEK